MNQFMATAVAEKLSAFESSRFFEDRYERMNLERFDDHHASQGWPEARDGDDCLSLSRH